MTKQLHLEIIGTGAYLPEQRVPNSFFTGRVLNVYDVDGNITDTRTLTEDGIFETTGIRERRKARADQAPSDLGFLAAKKALDDSGIRADTITGIVMASVTEDENFPNGAGKIQRQLGIRGCFAYDMGNACAGFPEALAQVNARVLRRPGNYLVVAAECLTNMVDYNDINSTLFGDGAGAVVLTPTEGPRGIVAEYSVSDPFDGKDRHIFRDKKRIMRMPFGKAVLREAKSQMVKSAVTLKEELGWQRADVYIPHQANVRITQGIANKVKADGAVVYSIIDRVGNMSSAGAAIALNKALRSGVIKPGHKVIITAFGSGEVTSAVAHQF